MGHGFERLGRQIAWEIGGSDEPQKWIIIWAHLAS